MSEVIMDKAFGYIDAMADKLGVASEHMYGILVDQAVASGVFSMIIMAIVLAVLVTITTLIIKVYTKAEYQKDSEGNVRRMYPINKWAEVKESDIFGDGLIWLLYGAVLIACSSVILATGYEGILRLINPEYYAIKEILDVFGK